MGWLSCRSRKRRAFVWLQPGRQLQLYGWSRWRGVPLQLPNGRAIVGALHFRPMPGIVFHIAARQQGSQGMDVSLSEPRGRQSPKALSENVS